MKKIVLFVSIALVISFLVSCGGKEIVSVTPTSTPTLQPSATFTHTPIPTNTNTPTPQPTETPQPTNTPTVKPTNTPTMTPTAFSPTLAEIEIAEEAGFSFQSPSDFLVEIEKNQVGLSSEDDEILIFMATNPPDGSTPEEVLANFISRINETAGDLVAEEPEAFVIDGIEGISADISGLLWDKDIEGNVIVVAPNESMLFLAQGLATNGRWENEGASLFSAVIESVSFINEDTDITEEPVVIEPYADFPLPLPVGKPASEWQGIAIMPQAIAGDGDNGGYSFIIEATEDEIQSFYETELSNAGWEFLATGEGETGAIFMVFQKSDAAASVSIIPVNDNIMYVMIVK